jgi:hypothetical protein
MTGLGGQDYKIKQDFFFQNCESQDLLNLNCLNEKLLESEIL